MDRIDEFVIDVALAEGGHTATDQEGHEVDIPSFYAVQVCMNNMQVRGVLFNEESMWKLYGCLDQIFGERYRQAKIAQQN